MHINNSFFILIIQLFSHIIHRNKIKFQNIYHHLSNNLIKYLVKEKLELKFFTINVIRGHENSEHL